MPSAMRRCCFPACDLSSVAATRECATQGCKGTLHHFCFASLCHDHNIDDPPNNDAYCWDCVTKDPLYKEALKAQERLGDGSKGSALDNPVIDETDKKKVASEACVLRTMPI